MRDTREIRIDKDNPILAALHKEELTLLPIADAILAVLEEAFSLRSSSAVVRIDLAVQRMGEGRSQPHTWLVEVTTGLDISWFAEWTTFPIVRVQADAIRSQISKLVKS